MSVPSMNTKEASLQPNSLHFAVVRRVKGIYDEGMEDRKVEEYHK